MKSTSRIMYALGAFLLAMAVVYAIGTTNIKDDGYLHGTEWAGIVGLVLATTLTFMLGGYLHFTERRIDILPEDWEEAEVEDKAGVLGFFSPSSIWPAAMSGAIFILGLGVIYLHWWMIALGAVCLIVSTAKMNLQYSTPREKH